MTHDRPTIAELRVRVQKERSDEIGNWLALRVARPTALYGCWAAIRLGLSANQVTLLALFCSAGTAAAIGSGDRGLFVVGVALAHLSFWLDHVDGQVARWRRTSSLDGVYFDYLMHYLANALLGFALGLGIAVRSGDVRWTIAGFSLALGWVLLSLHNDCRYKAFFQRLKSSTATFRVDVGSAARPQPPAPWPRHGRGMLTWPAYKACEIHVVLLGLTLLALVAIAAPTIWWSLWRGYVVFMSLLAPVLAIGRITRSVLLRSAELEFTRWFQPLGRVQRDGQRAAQVNSSITTPGS
jgi:phosphatidylglycerophosphate synthase